MANSDGPSRPDAFNDAAAAINAYVSDDGKDAYVEMIMRMDELEKFALIGALIHLILNPTRFEKESEND